MKKLLLLFFMLSFYGLNYAQEDPQSIHSGILYSTANGEEVNMIKLHCDLVQQLQYQGIILKELEKYDDFVKLVRFDEANAKIYIRYTDDLDPNMLLGILDRINITAYYQNETGDAVYHVKTGNEQYRR